MKTVLDKPLVKCDIALAMNENPSINGPGTGTLAAPVAIVHRTVYGATIQEGGQ